MAGHSEQDATGPSWTELASTLSLAALGTSDWRNLVSTVAGMLSTPRLDCKDLSRAIEQVRTGFAGSDAGAPGAASLLDTLVELSVNEVGAECVGRNACGLHTRPGTRGDAAQSARDPAELRPLRCVQLQRVLPRGGSAKERHAGTRPVRHGRKRSVPVAGALDRSAVGAGAVGGEFPPLHRERRYLLCRATSSRGAEKSRGHAGIRPSRNHELRGPHADGRRPGGGLPDAGTPRRREIQAVRGLRSEVSGPLPPGTRVAAGGRSIRAPDREPGPGHRGAVQARRRPLHDGKRVGAKTRRGLRARICRPVPRQSRAREVRGGRRI